MKEKTMKLLVPEIGHRNAVPFEGVALFVDVPTDRAGHFTHADTRQTVEAQRVLFKRSAVEQALPSLLGMAVCADETNFAGQANRNKVGFISEAWIEGNELRLRGFLYGLDFPDLIEAMKTMRNKLGMCPAYRDFIIEYPTEPNPEVIEMRELLFTGVAILKKVKAGFDRTSVRLLPQSFKWPCLLDGCGKFTVGAVRVFCPEHEPAA
jgi:hypothetical protein